LLSCKNINLLIDAEWKKYWIWIVWSKPAKMTATAVEKKTGTAIFEENQKWKKTWDNNKKV